MKKSEKKREREQGKGKGKEKGKFQKLAKKNKMSIFVKKQGWQLECRQKCKTEVKWKQKKAWMTNWQSWFSAFAFSKPLIFEKEQCPAVCLCCFTFFCFSPLVWFFQIQQATIRNKIYSFVSLILYLFAKQKFA